MFVSVTRLRLRSFFYVPAFLRLSNRSTKQVCASAGFRTGAELADRGLVFWTLTIWDSEQDMRAYRGSGAHAEAMRKLAGWCSEASIAHWQQDSAEVPSWDEAFRKLVEIGRLSRVDRPNENQKARRYREPLISAWRDRRLAARNAETVRT